MLSQILLDSLLRSQSMLGCSEINLGKIDPVKELIHLI